MTPRLRLVVVIGSLLFFVAHARTLPRTLEDIDSINFALGVEHFDVATHQPHPPGYPVYIAMARASTAAIGLVAPSWDRDRRAAAGLAVWGLVGGTLALWVFTEFWLAVGLTPTSAVLASLLAVMSPLFWFTAARPLTDAPALVAALAVATGLLRGLRRIHEHAVARPRVWYVAAAAAGLIIGIRSQTMWLTGPLLCWAVGELIARRRLADAGRLIGFAAAGTLVWAVPLVWLSGGLSRYLGSLGYQGTQDFIGIEMLATSPTWRLLRTSLARTFVQPWQAVALANVVIALGAIGIVRLLARGRRILAIVSLVFWPYLVFHLTFHETVTLRYALPLVVPVAGLAVIGLSIAGARLATIATLAAVVWSVIVVEPRLAVYATDGAPVFRAFQDMQRARATAPRPPVLRMHHQVYWGIRRVADWYRPVWDVGPIVHPGSREWLAVVDEFAKGDPRPVWFLSDVTRTDLQQFDPRARRLSGHYALPSDLRNLVGGARLDSLDWWTIDPPGWMLGRGWSLTPEVAGVTAEDGDGPDRRPAEAYLRRRPDPMRVLIGGRNLAGPHTPPAVVVIELAGKPIDQVQVSAEAPWFVRWIDLPDGVPSGPGAYARLTVRSVSVMPGGPAPLVGLEQFDAAPASSLMFALTEGWYELEEQPATGRLWRWSSARSVIETKGWGPTATLTIAGESPLRYFDHAPTVVVRAGDTEIGRFSPAADFSQSFAVPAAALEASGGRLSIDTDLTFAPADRGTSADRRRLGLRLYRVDVR